MIFFVYLIVCAVLCFACVLNLLVTAPTATVAVILFVVIYIHYRKEIKACMARHPAGRKRNQRSNP
jgi:hypothetical protein